MRTNATVSWLLVAAILVGGLTWYISSQKPDRLTVGESDGLSRSPVAGLRAEENAVYAPDQPPSDTVTVPLVGLSADGYVVIHADNDGAPGTIVGTSQLLAAGDSGDVVVTLSRPTVAGETLYAMLHVDDGDGTFDAASDAAVTSATGDVVMMRFLIDADATLPVGISI